MMAKRKKCDDVEKVQLSGLPVTPAPDGGFGAIGFGAICDYLLNERPKLREKQKKQKLDAATEILSILKEQIDKAYKDADNEYLLARRRDEAVISASALRKAYNVIAKKFELPEFPRCKSVV